jgi:hypothetical protein
MKKAVYVSEGILQLLIGVSALVSGVLMMIVPDGHLMSMPLSMLEGSPFKDFFFPGLILLSVNGLGNIFSGILSLKRHRLAGYAGIVFGLALIIWIFVQVSMIGGGHWLQYLYFCLGMLELLLAIGIREVERARSASL